MFVVVYMQLYERHCRSVSLSVRRTIHLLVCMVSWKLRKRATIFVSNILAVRFFFNQIFSISLSLSLCFAFSLFFVILFFVSLRILCTDVVVIYYAKYSDVYYFAHHYVYFLFII